MRRDLRSRLLSSGGALGMVVVALLGSSRPACAAETRPECESGMLDPGEAGLNVLVYRLCPETLMIGFESSEVIEEVSCLPSGEIRLWFRAGDARCDRLPASGRDQVHEFRAPLSSIGRSTAAPVRQLLLCRAGTSHQAAVIVPDARAALLETRIGGTRYEAITRRLISACVRPDV